MISHDPHWSRSGVNVKKGVIGAKGLRSLKDTAYVVSDNEKNMHVHVHVHVVLSNKLQLITFCECLNFQCS